MSGSWSWECVEKLLACTVLESISVKQTKHDIGTWCIIVQVVIVISLFGTCLSQIVASSSDAYYIHGHAGPDKRCSLLPGISTVCLLP